MFHVKHFPRKRNHTRIGIDPRGVRFFSVIYGLIHYRFGQKVVLLNTLQLDAGGIAIRPPVYLTISGRMIITAFGLRLFACFYSIHQDASILHPFLFRNGI